MAKTKKTKVITKAEIKDAVERSGYLLEQRVEPLFEEEGFYVETNVVYPDPATKKTREIDIEAIKGYKISRDYDFLFPVVICECKNNLQPVVFFEKDSVVSFLHYQEVKSVGLPNKILTQTYSRHPFKQQFGKKFIELSEFLNFEKYRHYCKGSVSTQYCSISRKSKDGGWMASHPDDQHETFMGLINALESRVEEYYKGYTLPKSNEKDQINIQIFYPLIIFQGTIYWGTIKRKNSQLKNANHIQFRKGNYVNGENKTYQIDVITEKFLPEYLHLIDKEMKRAVKILKRKKGIVRQTLDFLVQKAKDLRSKDSIRSVFH
ncbi:MAG: hypothetical protein WBD99_02580 [Thermodesulfobacteriota bacterium]